MIVFRSLIYQMFYGIWAFLMCFAFLPSLVLPFWASRFIARFWSASVFGLLRITVGLDHRIEGKSNIPAGPVIVASKHQSTWDTMIFPYVLDDPAIVVKRELYWIPFYGWYASKYGTIGIDRKGGAAALRRLIRDAKRSIAAGRSVVVFPEGTRTPPREKRVYQSGTAALYRELDVPVVPVALNSGSFWPRRSLIRRPGTITLRYLPAIPPGLDRGDFMRRLEDAIETAQTELEA